MSRDKVSPKLESWSIEAQGKSMMRCVNCFSWAKRAKPTSVNSCGACSPKEVDDRCEEESKLESLCCLRCRCSIDEGVCTDEETGVAETLPEELLNEVAAICMPGNTSRYDALSMPGRVGEDPREDSLNSWVFFRESLS